MAKGGEEEREVAGTLGLRREEDSPTGLGVWRTASKQRSATDTPATASSLALGRATFPV